MTLFAGVSTAHSVEKASAPVETSVFLNTEKQGVKYGGPELNEIRRTAEVQGISLDAAIGNHLAHSQRRARALAPNEPDGPVSTPSGSIDLLSAGELEDMEAIAAGEGITLDEAINRYGWQDEFVKVADALEAQYPDSFSGAEKLDRSAWFAFKGAAPAEALNLISTLPVPAEVVSRSFAEVALAAQAAAWAAAAQARGEVFNVAYDIRSGVIRADVEAPAAIGSASARAVTSAHAVELESITDSPFPVEVTITRGAALEEESGYIRGGGHLTGCTAGFNLKYITGSTKRLGTAGHCAEGSSSTYSNLVVAAQRLTPFGAIKETGVTSGTFHTGR
ncbi:hypothetical protein JNUCC64_13985 [Streptomyces sp. JNUCC 64]